jgi:hypothetical protein
MRISVYWSTHKCSMVKCMDILSTGLLGLLRANKPLLGCQIHIGFLLALLFDSESWVHNFLRNVGWHSEHFTFLYRRKWTSESCIRLWRWYINITITILDIVHRSVFYLKLKVSETGICLLLEMVLTDLFRIDGHVSIPVRKDRSQLNMFHMKTERESSLRNVVF